MHTLSTLDREEIVDAVVKGRDNNRDQITPLRTGRILHLSNCLRSGISRWTADAQIKRAGSAF
jgi:hypothetical protein